MSSVSTISSQDSSSSTNTLENGSPSLLKQSTNFNSEGIKIVKTISRNKFPIYLAASSHSAQNFALKVFRYQNKKPNVLFTNESRFSFLDHPNVVKLLHSEEYTLTPAKNDKLTPVSCLFMEYAPHGDFFDFVENHSHHYNEKLIRTYFHQLIRGLEYLHSSGVAHLDIKLENLLMGENYQLKIADFDLSYKAGDAEILTRGSKYYRAPELLAEKCCNGPAADIYSAAVVLFVMKTGGIIPHTEEEIYDGVDYAKLLRENPKAFFSTHCKAQRREEAFFDVGFRNLFVAMTQHDPAKRPSIQQIKSCRWYRGEIYSDEEVKQVTKSLSKN